MGTLFTLGLLGLTYVGGVVTGVYLSEAGVLQSATIEQAGKAAAEAAGTMIKKLTDKKKEPTHEQSQ